MKTGLPLKLGIFVVVVFGLLLMGLLLWKPLKIRRYASELNSNDMKKRLAALDKLLELGPAGVEALNEKFPDGPGAARLYLSVRDDMNRKFTFTDCKREPLHPSKNDLIEMINDIWGNPELDNRINESWWNALHEAAGNGYITTAAKLLENGADINANDFIGRTPLHWAAAFNKRSVAEYFVAKGADIEAKDMADNTPFLIAFKRDSASVVMFLAEKGADLGAKDGRCDTPLLLAVKDRKLELILHLIDLGADANGTGSLGGAPLHMAAQEGYFEVTKLLIKKGADINLKDGNGATAFQSAVLHNHLKIADFLLKKGAKLDEPTTDWGSLLHCMVYCRNEESVDFLVRKGADLNIIDDKSRTALDVACQYEFDDLCELLRKNGGRTAEELEKEAGKKEPPAHDSR